MSYRLKAGESVPEGIKRIVQEEIDSASDQLNHGTGKKRAEAVHEARKSVKKIRGVLRLMKPELGRTYRTENRRLRNTGRKLSEIRDAAAIIEIFDKVVEKYKDNLQIASLHPIRRQLERNKRELEQALGIQTVMRRAIATLHSENKRVKSWPLKKDGFASIAAGLEDTYRRGRKAMAVAQNDPRPENYHAWRKRVKDHWYQVRLLESLWTEVIQAREASLKNLETWLGDDHNLVVLCDKLTNEPEKYREADGVELFLTLAGQHQKELRENAMSLGRRIYEEKPRQFIQNMSKLWDAWQQQPESMNEIQREQRKAPQKQTGKAASAKSDTTAA